MKLINSIAFLTFSAAGLLAQSISPPIAEYRGNKVDGMFEIQNGADYPMAVLIETKSFDVDGHGQVHYRPLDKDVHLSLGASSFIIRPHDSHMVFYKASVPAAPNSFSIIATMTRAAAVPGMRINFVLPHMIYVYQKEKLVRTDIRLQLADGVLHIENTSQKLGRVASVQAPKQGTGGFPLYPGETREIAIAGDRATVNFEDGFKIELK